MKLFKLGLIGFLLTLTACGTATSITDVPSGSQIVNEVKLVHTLTKSPVSKVGSFPANSAKTSASDANKAVVAAKGISAELAKDGWKQCRQSVEFSWRKPAGKGWYYVAAVTPGDFSPQPRLLVYVSPHGC